MGRHQRALSFQAVDEAEASGILGDILKESDVFLGGSSIGKGLKKASNYYMKQKLLKKDKPAHFGLPGANDLVDSADTMPLEESFYVVDIGIVVSQVYQWRKYFPRIEAFMAVKCNPDPVIIKTLAVLGCNFDCASANEIRLVQECTADLPRKPDIIFANPCKPRSHILEAVCKGIRMVTFDNEAEIVKCASISKKIELILRIITDDRGSAWYVTFAFCFCMEKCYNFSFFYSAKASWNLCNTNLINSILTHSCFSSTQMIITIHSADCLPSLVLLPSSGAPFWQPPRNTACRLWECPFT